jgi:hypothetical protein
MGTQQTSFGKLQRKIQIGWELPEELMANGKPFTVSQRYTLSSHDKSTLRKHLEAWRGAPFTEEDFGKFKIENLLGKPCLLSIIHNETDNGTYANIASISRIMKGMKARDTINPQVCFDLEDFHPVVYESLSEGLKNIISKSPEYAEIAGKSQQPSYAPVDSVGDEIPF